LSDEYVLVGAHYDHLGMGGDGSGSRVPDETAIHYGADDNASGVASLLELARYFSANKSLTSRSIIFVAFGAEEMGIIGARYFTEHSPVPVKSIKAMINMDMVGRLVEGNSVINISGTGTSNVTDSLINIYEKNRIFTVKRVPDGYGPSDHAAFYTAGVPVCFITTGAHGDYHTPQDSPEKINYNGQQSITGFSADLISGFSNLSKAPVFAEAGTRREAGHYGRNLKVTLGIMPDVSGAETSGGMKVEGTRKGAPAERAGMIKGDIITAINGMKVSNIYDYMSRLGKLKPGDVVNVEIMRNDKTEILIIQL
jgi:aminopeptidase YwaD